MMKPLAPQPTMAIDPPKKAASIDLSDEAQRAQNKLTNFGLELFKFVSPAEIATYSFDTELAPKTKEGYQGIMSNNQAWWDDSVHYLWSNVYDPTTGKRIADSTNITLKNADGSTKAVLSAKDLRDQLARSDYLISTPGKIYDNKDIFLPDQNVHDPGTYTGQNFYGRTHRSSPLMGVGPYAGASHGRLTNINPFAGLAGGYGDATLDTKNTWNHFEVSETNRDTWDDGMSDGFQSTFALSDNAAAEWTTMNSTLTNISQQTIAMKNAHVGYTINEFHRSGAVTDATPSNPFATWSTNTSSSQYAEFSAKSTSIDDIGKQSTQAPNYFEIINSGAWSKWTKNATYNSGTALKTEAAHTLSGDNIDDDKFYYFLKAMLESKRRGLEAYRHLFGKVDDLATMSSDDFAKYSQVSDNTYNPTAAAVMSRDGTNKIHWVKGYVYQSEFEANADVIAAAAAATKGAVTPTQIWSALQPYLGETNSYGARKISDNLPDTLTVPVSTTDADGKTTTVNHVVTMTNVSTTASDGTTATTSINTNLLIKNRDSKTRPLDVSRNQCKDIKDWYENVTSKVPPMNSYYNLLFFKITHGFFNQLDALCGQTTGSYTERSTYGSFYQASVYGAFRHIRNNLEAALVDTGCDISDAKILKDTAADDAKSADTKVADLTELSIKLQEEFNKSTTSADRKKKILNAINLIAPVCEFYRKPGSEGPDNKFKMPVIDYAHYDKTKRASGSASDDILKVTFDTIPHSIMAGGANSRSYDGYAQLRGYGISWLSGANKRDGIQSIARINPVAGLGVDVEYVSPANSGVGYDEVNMDANKIVDSAVREQILQEKYRDKFYGSITGTYDTSTSTTDSTLRGYYKEIDENAAFAAAAYNYSPIEKRNDQLMITSVFTYEELQRGRRERRQYKQKMQAYEDQQLEDAKFQALMESKSLQRQKEDEAAMEAAAERRRAENKRQ